MYKRIIVSLFFIICLNTKIVFAQNRLQDSLALVELYDSTDGDSWTDNTNWKSNFLDTWVGVTVTNDRVTRLDLDDNNLAGVIPSSIGNLDSLTFLSFERNQLTGLIPPEISSLTNLEYLYLDDNQLSDSIPQEIGYLTNLRILYLAWNQLSGAVPAEIGNMTNLTSLYLQYNDLSDLPSLSTLTSLLHLIINNNKFTFEDIEPNIGVPSQNFLYSPQDNVGEEQDTIVDQGSSFTLSVSVGGEYNQYQWRKDGADIGGATDSSYTIDPVEMDDSGSYTCEITNTVAIDLILYSEPINVIVPFLTVNSPNGGEDWQADSVCNVTWTSRGTSGNVKIEYSTNNGSDWSNVIASTTDDGTYPWTVPDTPSDSCLIRISDTDGYPYDTSNAVFTISPAPFIMITSPNGGEDWQVGSNYDITWTSVKTLGFVKIEYSTNNGSDWSDVTTITSDDGTYPWTVPDTPSENCLVRISDMDGDPSDVSDGTFVISESVIPTTDSIALIELYDSTDGANWTNNDNWNNGPISTWFGVTVEYGRVTELDLNYNNLVGIIPASIGYLDDLIDLDLSSNQLTGSIPPEISSLTNLNNLYLSDNQFIGSIPPEIGNLTSISFLDLSYNQLSGSIPPEIGNLTDLWDLNLDYNQLTGVIPPEIGNLTDLRDLELNGNQLSGSVPSEIGNLTNLWYLRFYSNHLVDLPSLAALSSLAYLEIDNNKFTFEDIEPNIGVPSVEFTYSPQDSVGETVDTTVNLGSNFTMYVSVGGDSNHYQWKKGGGIISDAIDTSYIIVSADIEDSGSYICEVTNTVATELILYSRPINVTVASSAVPPELPEVYSMRVKGITTGVKFGIEYSLPEKADVRFRIYDIKGTRIKEISEEKSPGFYSKNIDMNDKPAGVYFIRMEANGNKFTEIRKVVFVR
jgi:Leucine-rich repeat (LRR) protein